MKLTRIFGFALLVLGFLMTPQMAEAKRKKAKRVPVAKSSTMMIRFASVSSSGVRLRRRNSLPSERVTVRSKRIRNGLKNRAVRKVVKRGMVRIQHCYKRAVVNGSASDVVVTANFVITKKGKVKSVKMNSTFKQPWTRNLERCVQKRIKAFVFPRAKNQTVFSYPFSFATK